MKDAPMRVLVVCWNYPPRRGGAEAYAHGLAREIAREYDLRLLTGRAPRPRHDEPWVERAPWRGVLAFLGWLLVRFPVEMLRRDYDLVLSIGGHIGAFVHWPVRAFGVPHAVILVGSEVARPGSLYGLLLRLSLPFVDAPLALSRATARRAWQAGLIGSGDVPVVYPGVDGDLTRQPAEATIEGKSGSVVLFVGRVVPRKGLRPFLQECLPRVLEHVDAEFWVVGGEAHESLGHRPGELAAVRDDLESSRLASRVRLLGEVDDTTLRAAYQRASVLVLPAVPVTGDVEGFGIVFLEAAMYGVPAVSTRLGGIPEAVVDGETGLLVAPEDWEGMAAAIERLLTDEDLRERLGERARIRARTEFTWRAIGKQFRDQLVTIRSGRSD